MSFFKPQWLITQICWPYKPGYGTAFWNKGRLTHVDMSLSYEQAKEIVKNRGKV